MKLLAAGLGLLVLALAGFALVSAQSQRVRVDRGPVGDRIVARGAVVANAGVTHVYAPSAATIASVLVREGDVVEPGQTLAELSGGERVKAPSRGAVLARHAEVGDYAQVAAQAMNAWLFELADPTQTELRVEVEAADAAHLHPGMPLTAAAGYGSTLEASGQVERVSPRLERRSIGADDARVRADGMVRVLGVTWRGEQPAWPIGTRVDCTLELDRKEAATRLPRSAVSVRDGRNVVELPGFFFTREVPVEVLRVDEAFAEIRGLAFGTEVVVLETRETAAAREQAGTAERVDVVEAVR